MPNPWGRSPRNPLWQDMQALIFWILVISVVGYFIFPRFFNDVFMRLTDPTTTVAADTGTGGNQYGVKPDLGSFAQDTPSFLNPQGYSSSVITSLYGSSNEVSSGYWVIFVADGEFKQLAVTSETYTFLTNLIGRDKNADPKNSVILAANGQIRKFTVSNEVYAIITNMAVIDSRTKTG